MKYRSLILCLAMALLCAGCAIVPDTYVSVAPHDSSAAVPDQSETIPVGDYTELKNTLLSLVSDGVEEAVLTADHYAGTLEEDCEAAITYVRDTNPETSYAVRDIRRELVQAGAYSKLNLTISYDRSYADLEDAMTVGNAEQAATVIEDALEANAERLLLRVTHYVPSEFSDLNYNALVTSLFEADPVSIMAKPTVTWQVSPSTGALRILEINFSYPKSSAELKIMKETVDSLIDSSYDYVRFAKSGTDKASLLYSYLAEHHHYTIKTTDTPAYKLLTEGEADSRTFASIYRAMCKRAGLTCEVVQGTKDKEDYCWIIISLEDASWHMDPLADEQAQLRRPRFLTDAQMESYEWDRNAYPECAGAPEPVVSDQQTSEQQSAEPDPPSDEPPAETAPEPLDPKPAEEDPPVDTNPQEK